MNVFEAIQKRREMTKFLDQPIPNERLEQILEAAYLAPSGNNLPSREFILITNREKLDELANATPFVSWLKEAKAAIAVTGCPEVSKYWLQDASIACGFIWLTATELGLGAAFGAIYHSQDQAESKKKEDFVRTALNIPSDRRVVAILGLGYPEKEPPAKEMVRKESIIHYERFQT
ncbi:MAG: nitroreductase [Bacillaceae bacterium]|nr:MAG: nitroreductase [Bacillaceae bacterium]